MGKSKPDQSTVCGDHSGSHALLGGVESQSRMLTFAQETSSYTEVSASLGEAPRNIHLHDCETQQMKNSQLNAPPPPFSISKVGLFRVHVPHGHQLTQ